MNIHLNIERLILDGLPITPGESKLVKTAVETELTRLLTANGLNPNFHSGGVVPSVKALGIRLLSDSRPADLGHQIARSVYRGIGRSE